MDNRTLLLKQDVFSRLPYGVFVYDEKYAYENDKVAYTDVYHPNIESCKPYLRSLSTMTAEEIKEYMRLRFRYDEITEFAKVEHVCDNSIQALIKTKSGSFTARFWYTDIVDHNTIDWLNQKAFDWRGLIPKGIAIEAPEEMYK